MSSTNLDERTLGALQLEWKQTIQKTGRQPVCWADLDTLLEDMLTDRMRLERRIKELERTPSLKFLHTYMDTTSYEPGDCATRQGGLWICTATTTGAFDHACWTLAVKKGAAA